MSDEFLAWKKLSESDIRSMLIALVGYDFGREPEGRIPEIRESRKSYSNYIGDQIALTSSDVVVDLGSGCGFGTYWFAKRAGFVHACDVSPAYLSFARRECAALPNVSFHQIESRNLSPLKNHSIDALCSMSVFIHLNLYDIYWYFQEFQRVVKVNGRVWIDFADAESLDLATPNRNGQLFIQHAEQYAANPDGLTGYMFWNSGAAIIGIARHFGFDCKVHRVGGELLFVNSGKPMSQ
jgi:SAM-dependent methyltransferase